LVDIKKNIIFGDAQLRCGSWNFAGPSPGSVEGGQEVGAERRGFAPSRRSHRPGRVEGEQPWYPMPVEEKECANSVRQAGLVFKMTYSRISVRKINHLLITLSTEDENLSEK